MNAKPIQMIYGGLLLLTLTMLPQHVAAQEFYVTNDNGNIQAVAADGSVSILANVSGANGLAIESNGDLLVSQDGDGSIVQVTPTGSESTFATDAGTTKGGLAIGSDGTVYSGSGYDYTNPSPTSYITVIPSTGGSSSTTLATSGAALINAYGLAFDTSGNLFVAGYTSAEVYKITPAGVVSDFASAGNFPVGVAVTSNGDVFAASVNGGVVDQYSPTGTLLNAITIPDGVIYGLTADNAGNVFAVQNLGTNADILEIASGSTTYSIFSTGLEENSDNIVFAAVPDPRTASLFLAGMIGWGWFRFLFRRQNSASPFN